MALNQLDAFLELARSQPELAQSLAQPLTLEDFLQLAKAEGFDLSEQDVFEAQARADSQRSDAELQAQAGEEARRLRSFIPG
jgi:predicted ribosomally synthesized peptide with nif11-like leader|tara:strand:+ start:523 stop:768 length:246 start_codon:yes stop_codon:yes gene_type:complete